MRLMILRAALFAAEADFGTAAAPADPESVQAPAPEAVPQEAEPIAQADQADETGATGDPAPETGSGVNSGAVTAADLRTASMAMPVIVRTDGKLAPGIVVEEDAGDGLTVQVFRGDHLPHVARHVARTEPEDTGDGWFFPWERELGR